MRDNLGMTATGRLAGVIAAIALAAPLAAPLAAQSQKPAALGVGKLLVANRKLADPNFIRSVILLLVYQDDAAVGLILNRRSHMSIASVYEMQEAKGRADVVYGGGPVERSSTLALLRASEQPQGATKILGDVSLISGRGLLRRTMGSPVEADSFRVFVGYAGWTGPQLQREVEIGAWYIFPGDSKTIFDPDPQTLWSRLVARTDGLLALLMPIPARAYSPLAAFGL